MAEATTKIEGDTKVPQPTDVIGKATRLPGPPPPKPVATPTVYVVLVSTDGRSTWREVGTQEASSRAQAVSKQFTGGPEDLPTPEPGVKQTLFQAVPERSWRALQAAPPEPRPPLVVTEADD